MRQSERELRRGHLRLEFAQNFPQRWQARSAYEKRRERTRRGPPQRRPYPHSLNSLLLARCFARRRPVGVERPEVEEEKRPWCSRRRSPIREGRARRRAPE